jgi:hypothetical protein
LPTPIAHHLHHEVLRRPIESALHDSFYDSWLGVHPRRSAAAHWNQYYAAKFSATNSIPRDIADLDELVAWFKPLLEAEERAGVE